MHSIHSLLRLLICPSVIRQHIPSFMHHFHLTCPFRGWLVSSTLTCKALDCKPAGKHLHNNCLCAGTMLHLWHVSVASRLVLYHYYYECYSFIYILTVYHYLFTILYVTLVLVTVIVVVVTWLHLCCEQTQWIMGQQYSITEVIWLIDIAMTTVAAGQICCRACASVHLVSLTWLHQCREQTHSQRPGCMCPDGTSFHTRQNGSSQSASHARRQLLHAAQPCCAPHHTPSLHGAHSTFFEYKCSTSMTSKGHA